ncbi:hypothetical protein C8R43DRAFT_942873 [Mycena crocata]|nr:hypothetical protein C8R43DRAFT_942873 [Mycena crocata]
MLGKQWKVGAKIKEAVQVWVQAGPIQEVNTKLNRAQIKLELGQYKILCSTAQLTGMHSPEYCRQLYGDAGRGAGYIPSPGSGTVTTSNRGHGVIEAANSSLLWQSLDVPPPRSTPRKPNIQPVLAAQLPSQRRVWHVPPNRVVRRCIRREQQLAVNVGNLATWILSLAPYSTQFIN